jgi:hypothetical protein
MLSDGRPADPALERDWREAVLRVRGVGISTRLEFDKD